jgi:hypothetical protein
MATKDELREVIKATLQLIKEAEGSEHIRLREIAEELATGAGFPTDVSELDGCYPDVLRIGKTYPRVMFVADAKDAANQRATDSRAQILGYIQSIKKRLDAGLHGAIVLIATNDEKAAREWEEALPVVAKEAGVTVAGCQYIPADKNTFLIVLASRK